MQFSIKHHHSDVYEFMAFILSQVANKFIDFTCGTKQNELYKWS